MATWYGNNGGTGSPSAPQYGGGGGGGAGSVGSNGAGSTGGAGGSGYSSSITGSAILYGGGGGGGVYNGATGGPAGSGGGGIGSSSASGPGDGVDGLGGGGGGASTSTVNQALGGGDGGNGVVIVRYLASAITATGGTETDDGLYKVRTFLSSGTFEITSGSGDVEYLVVGGGGGGGGARTNSWGAGGGGGGGVVVGTKNLSVGSYSVVVGTGGSGGIDVGAGSPAPKGINGGDSSFDGMAAYGGGGGAGCGNTDGGLNGGSGGGGTFTRLGGLALSAKERIEVTSLFLEGTVGHSTSTRITSLLLEAVVATLPQRTYISAVSLDSVGSREPKQRISSFYLEAVVANFYVEPVEDSDIGVEMLSVLNEVVQTDKYLPLTGEFNPEETIPGWIYDKRRLENNKDISTKYNTYLGGHTHGLLDGTAFLDWVSGTVSGIGYEGIFRNYFYQEMLWTPFVTTGEYSIFWDRHRLYSDKAQSLVFNEDEVDEDLFYVALPEDAKLDSLELALWKRTSKSYIMKIQNYDYVLEFSGDYSSGEQLETEDGDGFIPANFNTRKKEFTVRDDNVYLNQDSFFNVGWDPELVDLNTVTVATVTDLWEHKGSSSGSGRFVYSTYFPLQVDKVRLAVLNEDTWIECEEVENLNFSTDTDNHFSVDHELGIIKTSGFKAEDLVLKTSIDDTEDEFIEVHFEPEKIRNYPNEGIIIIGSEEILYEEKSQFGFRNLTRGHNSTTAAAHTAGAVVSDIQHGASLEGEIYISYVTSPRLDFEVTAYNYRTANAYPFLDVNPLKNYSNEGVLQIKSSDRTLKKIILSTDAPHLGGINYGPMRFGFDTSRLTALALDVNYVPVEEMPLSIEIIDGPGLLNSAARTYESITNILGEMYCYFNASFNQENIEKHVTSVVHADGDTVMTVGGISPDVSLNDVWVFEILKDDPIFGTIGNKFAILDADLIEEPYADVVIRVDGILDEDYLGGQFSCIGTDNIIYKREIVTLFQYLDSDDIPVSEITIKNIADPSIFTGQDCHLFKRGSLEWSASLKNGVRRILYEWNNTAIHPITEVAGAYSPVHPSSRDGDEFTFADRELAIPAPEDLDSNLGGYLFIAPGLAKIQAFGRDPLSNQLISSNVIQFQLFLNDSLIGVRNNSTLPIPIGWTLLNSEHNVGSGLGGANFISINPHAENINQLCLMANITEL